MSRGDYPIQTGVTRCDAVKQYKSEPESAESADVSILIRPTRRYVLSGLGAGFAQTLFRTPLKAARLPGLQTGEPGKLDFRLGALSPKILHISIAPVHDDLPKREAGILDSTHESPLELKGDLSLTVPWDRHTIRIDREPLRIEVVDDAKRVRQEIQFDIDSTSVRFRLGSKPLFGLGEGLFGDRRGTRDLMRNGQSSPELRTTGSRVPIPWLISPEGWGIFIGLPLGTFDLTGETGVVSSPVATSTRNVYLILGDSPDEVLRGYAELSGLPHLPPLWSLGYLQSHRTLANREEVMGVAKAFREKKLPCDGLIYLGTGFCPSGWNTGHGSFTFNAQVFPDPEGMLDELHQDHFNVVLHVVPPHDFHGKVTDTGSSAQTSGDAVPYWAKHVPLEQMGVDGWWPDEGDLLPPEARLERNEMYWDGQAKARPEKRPFALHRNGYAGLQRYGWLWSGDVDSTWETLASQVADAINVGLCGIPYWGTDTGGFVPTLELTPELYVRWFQFSAFCPLFRSHGRTWKLRLPWGWNLGTPGPLEGAERLGNWPAPQDLHNPDVERICRKFLELRYQLLPYIYSTFEQAHRTGLPPVRALWLAHPNDERALRCADQYMWGDHILVAPVLEPAATKRSVYLPSGVWWDFWTNQRTRSEQGIEITRELDLSTIPLYMGAGAIVPMGPVRQYATEPTDEPVTLRIYPSADGSFSWYQDDGVSFAYQHGHFLRIDCSWQDNARKLTLEWSGGNVASVSTKVVVMPMDTEKSKTIHLTDPVTVIDL
jgi:alpha-glucosidase (family GH31 glycosyl hydrolase)